MPIRNPAEFIQAVPAGSRLLGMDIGKRFIGLAITDPLRQTVLPLQTLAWESWGKTLPQFLQILASRAIGGFVLGIPLNTDGSQGPAAQTIQAFASNLLRQEKLILPYLAAERLEVTLMDERYTTDIAQTLLGNNQQKNKAKGALDATAAQIILEDFLTIYGKN